MYVDRENGEIVRVYRRKQFEGQEFVENPHIPEVTGDVRVLGKHQLMLQLIADGKRAQWNALKQSINTGDADTKEVWGLTSGLAIDHPLVTPFATSFGYDAVALQDLWNRAAKQ